MPGRSRGSARQLPASPPAGPRAALIYPPMDIPNGLVCRYCGKKWFKHDIVQHEKNCFTKLQKIVQVIQGRISGVVIPLPPPYEDWPVPPATPLSQYNQIALKAYNNSWAPCPGCSRRFPILALNDHLSECSAPISSRRAAPTRSAGSGAGLGSSQRMGGTQKAYRSPAQRIDAKEAAKSASFAAAAASAGVRPGQPQRRPAPSGGAGGAGGSGRFAGASSGAGGDERPSAKGAYSLDNLPADAYDEDPEGRIACQRCGRKFAPDRIGAHESVCMKLKSTPDQPRRGVAAVSNSDRAKMVSRGGTGPMGPTREGALKYSAFAKGVPGVGGHSGARGGDDPVFDEVEADDGRVACRRCGRKFNPDRIDKHESICQSLTNIDPRAGAPAFRASAKPSLSSSTRRPSAGVSGSTPAKARQTAGGMGSTGGVGGAGGARGARPAPKGGAAAGPKFCSQCGHAFGSGAGKFCSECGAPRR